MPQGIVSKGATSLGLCMDIRAVLALGPRGTAPRAPARRAAIVTV
ncbi:hypothetical protein SAMN05518801_1031 [Novosphingobium sp. CF614]|nr:hypothetical protein [Novosphingobium sp. CF614]SFF89748.1 hypothetical protein SAMN05518801_1031 [Novosphingobium sp. CF614]